mgnify:CR=1 FL=1
MTTIVYDHKNKQIACDSRMSKSSGSYSNCYTKMVWNKNILFILTGSTCDMAYFRENYEKYKKVEVDVELDCSGIIIRDGVAYNVFIHEGVFNEDICFCDEFTGSGGKYAVSSLDHGCTAKEAVEYAITRDCFSGGKVHVYDIETAKFI